MVGGIVINEQQAVAEIAPRMGPTLICREHRFAKGGAGNIGIGPNVVST